MGGPPPVRSASEACPRYRAREPTRGGHTQVTRQRDDGRQGTGESARRRRADGGAGRAEAAEEPAPRAERRLRGGGRSGRRSGPVVAVTGAAGPAGAAVAAGLQLSVGERGGPKAVIAVDTHEGDLEGPEWRGGGGATPMGDRQSGVEGK